MVIYIPYSDGHYFTRSAALAILSHDFSVDLLPVDWHTALLATPMAIQFEITKGTREAVAALIKLGNLHSKDFLFRSRIGTNQHISTRQYNRIFHGWVEKLGLEDSLYSTHSMRRTKPYLIYKKTKNLRVIQLLLGHKKLESTVRYLGIEVDDALEISESIEV